MIIEQFKNWLIVNDKSDNTVRAYTQKVKEFLKEVKLEDINEENLIKYLLKLREKYSKSSIILHKYAIKVFLKYLKKDIPMPKVKQPEKKVPEYITEEFFEKKVIPVLEASVTAPLKMKTIFYFMFYTGIRVGELNTLKREDIDLTKRELKIKIPKRNEERIVFLVKKIIPLLKSYFELEPEVTNAFNITSNAIQQVFKRIKINFKEVNLKPHLFRHSFAVMALKKGASIEEDVMKWLGHKNINSTLIYTKLNIKDSHEKFDKVFK